MVYKIIFCLYIVYVNENEGFKDRRVVVMEKYLF